MEHPKIEFESKTYYQVGCKKCQKGEDWNIYSDGKQFVAKCKCGNTLIIKQGVTQSKPDAQNAIPLHNII